MGKILPRWRFLIRGIYKPSFCLASLSFHLHTMDISQMLHLTPALHEIDIPFRSVVYISVNMDLELEN